jgi:ABC-2 type transport system permease protein
MFTVLGYTFKQFRGQILGWGLGVAALGMLLVPFYDVFMGQQEDFMQMVESYPPEMLAFFGDIELTAIATPEGYLNYYLFSFLPIILGIFAVAAGSGLFASDEEAGRLDLIMAHPLDRTALFGGRLLALVGATLAILLMGWLGCVVLLGGSALTVNVGELALPFLAVLAQMLIYGSVALLLSMLLPSRRLAVMAGGMVLVASYVLSSLARLNESLAAVANLLPYAYYQGGRAMSGLNLAWFGGLLAASAALAALAWWRFLRRDIRVAGEGGWKFPLSPKLRRARERT